LIGFGGSGSEEDQDEFVIPNVVSPTVAQALGGAFRIYKLLPNRPHFQRAEPHLKIKQSPYEDFIRAIKYENRRPTEWTDGTAPMTFFATGLLALLEEWKHWQSKQQSQNNLRNFRATLNIAECEFLGRVETLPPLIERGMQGQKYIREWVSSGRAGMLLVPSSRGQHSEIALMYQSVENLSKTKFLKVHVIDTHLSK